MSGQVVSSLPNVLGSRGDDGRDRSTASAVSSRRGAAQEGGSSSWYGTREPSAAADHALVGFDSGAVSSSNGTLDNLSRVDSFTCLSSIGESTSQLDRGLPATDSDGEPPSNETDEHVGKDWAPTLRNTASEQLGPVELALPLPKSAPLSSHNACHTLACPLAHQLSAVTPTFTSAVPPAVTHSVTPTVTPTVTPP
jgi:hypothetical protein